MLVTAKAPTRQTRLPTGYFAVSSSIAVIAASASSRRGENRRNSQTIARFRRAQPGHFLLPIREEVVEAALAKTGGLADQGKARSFVSMLAKNFGQEATASDLSATIRAMIRGPDH